MFVWNIISGQFLQDLDRIGIGDWLRTNTSKKRGGIV